MPKIISAESPEIEYRKRPVKGVSLYVAEEVIVTMTDHAEKGYNENKEIMGLLTGQTLKDDEGIYVRILDSATSDLEADEVSVRFCEGGLEELFDSIDKCKGDMVIGWYHSHLGIGCYLSDVDIRTHMGIFGDEIGFAIVIDPSDETLAAFSCDKDGQKKVPMIVLT